MKLKILFLLVTLFSWKEQAAAQETLQLTKLHDEAGKAITADEYCEFLNAVATSDTESLYEERSCSYQIIRLGEPGSYRYNLIDNASTSNVTSCIAGLSWNDALHYDDWRHHSASTFNLSSCAIGTAHIDPFLKSNQLTFQSANNDSTAYQAGEPEAAVARAVLDELIEAAIALSLGETMTASRPESARDALHEHASLDSAAMQRADASTTRSLELSQADALNHLRRIVEANPTATRLIVTDEGDITSIHPQEELPNAGGRNRSENKKTIDALRILIPSGLADDLLQYRTSTVGMHVDSLSAQRLRAILDRYDASRKAIVPKAESRNYLPPPPQLKMGGEVEINSNQETGSAALLFFQADVAELLKEQAVQRQAAASYYAKAIEAYAQNNKQEAMRFKNAADAAGGDEHLSSAAQLEKAIAALKKATVLASSKELELAELSKEQAVQHQAAASYYAQVATAYAQNDEQEALCFNNAADTAGGDEHLSSAAQLEKAITALEKTTALVNSEELELAKLSRKQAKKHQVAASYYAQAAKAYAQNNGVEAMRFDNAAEATGGDLYPNNNSAAQLEKRIAALEKTFALINSEQLELKLEELSKKLARQREATTNYSAQAAAARAQNNKLAANSFHNAAVTAGYGQYTNMGSLAQLTKAFTALETAITLANREQLELAALYKKQAKQHQAAANYYAQAAEAYAQNNESKATRFNNAAHAAGNGWLTNNNWHMGSGSATQLEKAIIAFEKASALANSEQLDLAELFKKLATQRQAAASYYAQAAKAYAKNSKQKALRFRNAAGIAGDGWHLETGSADQLERATDALEKAAILTISGKLDLAEQLQKQAMQYQSAASCYVQAAKAYAQDNKQQAEFYAQAAKAHAQNNKQQAEFYIDAARISSLEKAVSDALEEIKKSKKEIPSSLPPSFRDSSQNGSRNSSRGSFRASPQNGSRNSSRGSSRSRANSIASNDAKAVRVEWPPGSGSPNFVNLSEKETIQMPTKDAHFNLPPPKSIEEPSLPWIQAKEAEAAALHTEAQAMAIPSAERESLWSQAIQQADKARKAWTEVADSEFIWIFPPFSDFEKFHIAKNGKRVWDAKEVWYQAELAESTTYTSQWFEAKKAENAANKKRKKREAVDDSKKAAMLDEVIQRASQAAEIWNTVVMTYQAHCKEALEAFKESWRESLAEVEHRATTWVDKLMFYKTQREKIGPLPFPFSIAHFDAINTINSTEPLRPASPSPMNGLSAEEEKDFVGATFEAAEERDNTPSLGQKMRIRILKTDLQYPYLRVEEIIDFSSRVISRTEMVADHFLVTLANEETPEVFRSKFQELNLQEIQLEKITNQRYLLHFKPASLEAWNKVWEKAKTIPGANPKEDLLSHDSSNSTQKKIILTNPEELEATQWNLYGLRGINARETWRIQDDASNVIAAVLDSGIDFEHLALKENKDSSGYDFVKNAPGVTDENGHGTHCAGIIGAREDDHKFFGVAKKINLMSVRWMDKDKCGYDSNFLKALLYACNNGAAILNCSASQAQQNPDEDIKEALRLAQSKGIIVVVSAGNDGKDLNTNPRYPGSYRPQFDNMIVVAATQKNSGSLAGFSNKGTEIVDIAAPGEAIFSTWLTIDPETGAPVAPNNEYSIERGTSMAVPHVVGALALMKAKWPDRSCTDLINHLYGKADYVPELEADVCGGRRLNVHDALREFSYEDSIVPDALIAEGKAAPQERAASAPDASKNDQAGATEEIAKENIESNEQSERDEASDKVIRHQG